MKINLENTPQPNGSQFATPTPGPREMTPEEWLEYCDRVRAEQAPPRHQTTIQRQTPCGSILTVCAEHDDAIRAGTITPRDHTGREYSQVRQGARLTGDHCSLCPPAPSRLKTAAALRAMDFQGGAH